MRAFELALIEAHSPGQESAGLVPGQDRDGPGGSGGVSLQSIAVRRFR